MKPSDFKRKACLMNLTHNENSSKNINISINYNLGSPKYPYPQSLKGRKIERLTRPIEERSFDNMKPSFKESIPGCDISLKLIKKKNQERLEDKIKSRTGKIQRPKKRMEGEGPMTTTAKQGRERRLFTEYQDMRQSKDRDERLRFNKSTDHVRTKSEPRARGDDMVKKLRRKEKEEKEKEKAVSEEKPKRVKNKSTILDRNRTEADLKEKSKGKKKRDSFKEIPLKQPRLSKKPEKEKDKERSREKQKDKEREKERDKGRQKQRQSFGLKKPAKKPTKKRFFTQIDFEPFLMSRFLNSSVISDQLHPSSDPSRQSSDRKDPSNKGNSINLFVNTNSIELVPINEIRRLEREAGMKHYADEVRKRYDFDKAANIIKEHWKEYHTRKIIKYYNSVFEKNSKEEYVEDFSEIRESSGKQEEKQIDYEEEEEISEDAFKKKQQRHEEEQDQLNSISAQQVIKRRRTDSPVQQEEDTYFDIKKYQKMVKKTLQQDSKQKIAESKSSSKVNSKNDSPRLRQKPEPHQEEQWDNINRLLHSQFNKAANTGDSNQLLNELIRQSEYNRKWIEDGSAGMIKEQTAVEGNSKHHFKTYDSDEGITSRIEELMNNELMNNSESEGNIRMEGDGKGECIDNYLDCGLESCGLQNVYDQPSNALDRHHRRDLDGRDINNHPSLREGIEQSQESPGVMFESRNQYLAPEAHSDNEKTNTFQSMRNYNIHLVFEDFFNSLFDEFCQEVSEKQKVERMCKRAVKKMVSAIHHKHSIKTNHSDIMQYVEGLAKYVLTNPVERAITLKNINCTLGPTSSEMLYYLRIEDDDEVDEDEFKEETLFVISLDTFQRYEQLMAKQTKLHPKQQMYEHYWHRALFQGLNEALDEHRPYGTYGKPYAWQVVSKVNGRHTLNNELKAHLQSANIRLLQITSYMGGVIQEKEANQFAGMGLSEEDYEQINQERVSRMLADELMEEEETWINYLDEKVEIELQVIELIEESFMLDVARELKKIQLRRAFTNEH